MVFRRAVVTSAIWGVRPAACSAFFDRLKVTGGGQHLDGAFFVSNHVFGPGLQGDFHHLVFVGAGGEKYELTLVLES